MNDTSSPDIAAVPKGRMMTVRVIETALKSGETYGEAARRAKVSLSTAKHWPDRLPVEGLPPLPGWLPCSP